MAALNPPKAGPVREEPDAIRLVLFGMPDAGKSSLLGALAQTAHSQVRTLYGHLSDLSNGLTELRRQLYDADGSDSTHEITPYPVRFIPFGKENTTGYQAILYDCDGNAVNQMLIKQKKLDAAGSPLVDAVQHADALLLLIDASATYDQLADDFRQFVRFLKTLEGHRTHHHAVGGWPIFLVLTKCDLLAREPISRSMWQARIEAREKEVAAQFKDFFEEEDELPAEYLAFGSLDVQVRSVGVSRPKLTDAEAQAREPFGVAELFHDAMNTGLTYKHRSQKSGQRLAWTVFGAGGLLAAMATVAGLLVTAPPAPEPQLALSSKVEMVQASEGSTAVARLAGTAIDRRLRELTELKNNADFEKLPEAQKNYITNRITEAQTYIKFRDELFAIPGPGKTRTLDELKQVEQRLTKLSVPVAYQGEWQQTEAVQQRERMLQQEIPALKDAVGKLTTYYQLLTNRARSFYVQTTELTPEWETRVTGLLDEAEKGRPFTKSDPLHGSAYKFDDVALAEGEWQKLLTRLTGLRDIATALGLLGDGTKAPLALTEPPANADIAALATKRMQLLKTTFPEYTSWKISSIPEAVQPDIVRRLKRSKEQCERDGQRLLHAKLRDLNPGSTELAADWPRVADYLADANLQDYRALLGLLTKLFDANAEDPAQAAIAFLKRPAFDLDVKTLKLTIADVNAVEPAGDVVFVYRRGDGGDTMRLSFRQTSKDRVGQTVTYTFTASGASKLTYKPGDTFFAELPLKRDMKEMKFTWSSSRTNSYQFERLFRDPQLHDATKSNLEGLPATGVTVTIDKFPMVPAIVPLVRLDKR